MTGWGVSLAETGSKAHRHHPVPGPHAPLRREPRRRQLQRPVQGQHRPGPEIHNRHTIAPQDG
jgi:hypothetical protein